MSSGPDDDSGLLALSELEAITVIDADGLAIGELLDIVALAAADRPAVTGFIIEHADDQLRATWSQVAEIDVDGERLVLSCPVADLEPVSLRGDELALVEAVLDKQVLDIRRRAFVRVQDVLLEVREGELVVSGIDAGHGALARRFGLGFLSRRLPRRPGDFVPWGDVNLIALRLSRLNFIEAFAELAELHPADIADVIGQVGPRERVAVLAALNTDLAADTLQELDEDLSVAALQEMSVERAAAVLERIEADEAADIVGRLPRAVAQQLLARLPDEREDDLRELASHPEHTAGSLMTTEFVTLPLGTEAGAALDRIRHERPERHAMTYIYVLGGKEQLVGVTSLRDLVLAEPSQKVDALMEDDVVTVAADTKDEEVGRVMTKYDLLAIPVIDEEGRLLGVVTIDDALDGVLPGDWTQRLPRLFR